MWLLSNWYAAFDSRLVAFLGGYLVLLILAVSFDIGVFSGGHRAMKRKKTAL